MDIQAISEAAQHLMQLRKSHRKAELGHIYYHGQRVGNLAVRLHRELLRQERGCQAGGIDIPQEDTTQEDILRVAGWFHDVGKGIEPHPVYGAVLAREALAGYAAPEELDAICELIHFHAARRRPEEENAANAAADNAWPRWREDFSDGIQILQDADLLDHFGTAGIAHSFFSASFSERRPAEQIAHFFETAVPLHEKSMERLNYSVSKAIMQERVAFEENFFRRFRTEAQGEVWTAP
ncbi:MAG: HD domain-containing protein [Oscillospiraceae bacterium]|jgi:uncharacterized protein|nr:HD domain-containing protein [Oscillospiraceae bacterium]